MQTVPLTAKSVCGYCFKAHSRLVFYTWLGLNALQVFLPQFFSLLISLTMLQLGHDQSSLRLSFTCHTIYPCIHSHEWVPSAFQIHRSLSLCFTIFILVYDMSCFSRWVSTMLTDHWGVGLNPPLQGRLWPECSTSWQLLQKESRLELSWCLPCYQCCILPLQSSVQYSIWWHGLWWHDYGD